MMYAPLPKRLYTFTILCYCVLYFLCCIDLSFVCLLAKFQFVLIVCLFYFSVLYVLCVVSIYMSPLLVFIGIILCSVTFVMCCFIVFICSLLLRAYV